MIEVVHYFNLANSFLLTLFESELVHKRRAGISRFISSGVATIIISVARTSSAMDARKPLIRDG